MKIMIQQKKKQQVHINDLPYNTGEQDFMAEIRSIFCSDQVFYL